MPENKNSTITIIGAGLAGCFLAIILAKKGYKVDIYERQSEEDTISTSSKRSFNLTFYSFGADVLKNTRLWEIIKPILIKVEGSMTQVSQEPVINRYNKAQIDQYLVQRAKLLEVFIKQAKLNQLITFHFSTKLISINRQNRTISVENVITQKQSIISCNVIFGADGINSKVREFLQEGQEAKHTKEYAPIEYKQISLSKKNAENINLKYNVFYTWTRKSAALLAHPNKDKSFSALLILPKDMQKGFDLLNSKSNIEYFFKKNFSDLLTAIEDISKELLENPPSYLATIYTEPWYYKDFMAIIGDAAHGFLPFYGQGVSAAFVDCLEIAKLIDNYGSDWDKIFPEYQKARKKNTDALANLSKEIFALYLRHKKADYNAIYNKFESILYKLFPQFIQPEPFIKIASNPDDAAKHAKAYKKQRKIAKYFGVPILIYTIKGLVTIEESLYHLMISAKDGFLSRRATATKRSESKNPAQV